MRISTLRRRPLISLSLPMVILIAAMCSISPVFAQSLQNKIKLSPPAVSEYPDLTFDLAAFDSDLQVIKDLDDLQLSEDGIPITEFTVETVKIGSEVVFVIDANTDIEERDEDGGLSRREKVRESILRYADRYMDPDLLDRVSIIVPDEQSGRYLEEPAIVFHNAVKNAINFYIPVELGDTPLNNMMDMAIQQAEQGRKEGRSAAVVLFSDSGDLNEQLDFDDLVEQSLDSEVVIYTAILGESVETWEADDAERLTRPTGGYYIHMPQPEDADPIYGDIRDRAAANTIAYRSSLNTSGTHTLAAQLDDSSGTIDFELVVAPPSLELAIDNSQPIVRVASDALTPIEEAEPKIQPLAANLRWPDGHTRELKEVTLFVDGQARSPNVPVLDANNLLTFDWDIREFGAGVYAIQIQVEDELGLLSLSEPLPLTIELSQPVFQPTSTPAPTPTPVPTPIPEPTPTPAPVPLIDLARDNAVILGTGAGAAFFLAVVIIIVLLIARSRRKRRSSSESTASGGAASDRTEQGDKLTIHDTFAMVPEFAALATGAYLEALENAPDHATLIPLTGNNLTLGRDPRAVQIYFTDLSVSGLHARILESNGTYRIYDEGSTSGTFVNFQRIGLTPRILYNRDEIHLGRVHLRFHLVTAPADQDDQAEQTRESFSDDTPAI